MNISILLSVLFLGQAAADPKKPEVKPNSSVTQTEPEIFVFNEDRSKLNAENVPHSTRFVMRHYATLAGEGKWKLIKEADISLIDKMNMMWAWMPESDYEIKKLKRIDLFKFCSAKIDKDGHLFRNDELKLIKEIPQTDRSHGYVFKADNGEFCGRFYGRVDKQGKIIDFAVMKKKSDDILEAHYLVKNGAWIAKAGTIESP